MADDNTYLILSDPEMKEIVDSFIVESKEILEKLDFDLVELERKSDDADFLNQIFRAFHTIKGTSDSLVWKNCRLLLTEAKIFLISFGKERLN